MGSKLSYPEVDLTGRVAVITGGNTGIGYETAKGLVRLGAHTFIACRSKERAEAAIHRMKNELNCQPKNVTDDPREKKTDQAVVDVAKKENESQKKKETGKEDEGKNSDAREGRKVEQVAKNEEVRAKKNISPQESIKEIKVEFLPLDLASFQSTVDFVHAFKEKNLPLHILINNAALAWVPFELTGDGYEIQLQVNHLSPMLLTLELLPLMLDTTASPAGGGDVRIIFVSSGLHYRAADFNAEKVLVSNLKEEEYDRLGTYSITKLYNVMIGFAMQRHLKDCGITVSSVEPGYKMVRLELARGLKDKGLISFISKIGYSTMARTPIEAAATSLNCAVNPNLNTQKHYYFKNCKATAPSSDARNKAFQETLWKRSIELIKEKLSSDIVKKYYAPTEPPVTDEGPPATDEGPPATDEGPPATDEGSPDTDERPGTDERPPDTDEGQATNGPPATDEGPSDTDEEPATDERPPDTDEGLIKPPATDGPTAIDKAPIKLF